MASAIAPVAAGAAPDRLPPLAGHTTVIAAKTSRIDVSLPRPVTLPYSKDGLAFRGIAIEGSGRYVGVSLVDLKSQDGLAQLLIRPCFSLGCNRGVGGEKPIPFAISWSSRPVAYGVSDRVPPVKLPAGDYVLSVITDGSPVTVHLDLAGLRGVATYRTRLPQHATTQSPAERVTGVAAAQPEAQSGGIGWVDTGVQLLAQTHLSSGQMHVTDESTWCVYDGTGPADGVMPPGCPDADESLGFGATYVAPTYKDESFGMSLTIMPASTTPPPATYFQGYEDYGVENISTVHDNFLWASLGAPKQ